MRNRHADAGERLFGWCARESRSVAGRKAMTDRDHALRLVRRAKQLEIGRGSIYYLPRPVSPADLTIMRRTGKLCLLYHSAKSRTLRNLLRQERVILGDGMSRR
jgi:hypothetical protein